MRKPPSAFSSRSRVPPSAADVAIALHAGWIGDAAAQLRDDDRREASELSGFLAEIARALPTRGARVLVDAAAGRGLVGVMAAHFFLGAGDSLTLIERQAPVLERACEAASRLCPAVTLAVRCEDLTSARFGERPHLVTALHACGDASDSTIERAIGASARRILVAPCCVAAQLPVSERGYRAAERSGLPDHGEPLRRYVEAWVMAERVLVLEAAGYRTEVVAFTSPRITPHNLVLRAQRVGEPVRAARAAEKLRTMHALSAS